MKTHSALLFCSLLISYLLSDTVSSYKFSKSLFNSQKCFTRQYRWETFATSDETVNEAPVEDALINPENITSKKITKYEKDIAELKVTIENLRQSRKQDEGELETLNKEYGSEIERVKKEFSRIKERAQEESRELQKQAKVDAVKAILPINDDYLRAKSVYLPLQNENEEAILSYYDGIFTKLGKILEEFGATRVVSLGQPFDYTVMEAIMTAPSTEYAADIVMTEYQVGYRMGDKCIRPSIVVVSTGPGPE